MIYQQVLVCYKQIRQRQINNLHQEEMMNFQSLLKSFTKDNDNKNESGLKERQQQKQQQKQSQSQHNNQSISNSNNNNNKQINQSQQSRLLRLLQQKKKQVDDIKKGYQTFLLVSAQKISQYQKYHKENIQLKIKIQLLEKEIMMMNNRGIVIKQQSGNNNMMVNGLHSNNNQDRQDYNKRFDTIQQLIKNIPKQINITTQLSTSKQQQNNQYPINKQINLQQQHKQKQQQQHMYRKRIREIQKKVMELQQQKNVYQQQIKQIDQQNASYVEENKLLRQQNSSLKGKLYTIEQKNKYQWNHMKKIDNNNSLQQQQLQLNIIQLARQQSATIPSITKQHSTTITKQQQQYILKQQQQFKLRRQQTLTQSNSYNQLQKQLQIKKKTIQQLTQQLQLFQINQSKSQCKIKQAQTKINQLTSQLIQGQIQYNKLRQENTVLSNRLTQYENKYKQCENKSKQCENSLLQAQRQIQRLKQIQSFSMQQQSYHRTIINQLTIQKNNLSTILKDIRQYLIKKYSLSQQINITNHNLSQQLPNIINHIIQQENNKQSLYKQYQQDVIKLKKQVSLYCQRIKQLQMIIQKHNNNNNNNYKHKYKIGTKLITSNIIHGHDLQRYQLLQQIQQFTNMKIKRTDILVRYPDIKSMIHQLPKQSNNFPFLLLYKGNNAVFGSYSDGMKKRTCIFCFIVDNSLNQIQQKQQCGSQQQQQQQILPKKISQQQTKQQQFLKQLERQRYDVRFYIPQRDKLPQQLNNKQYRVSSIQIFQSKYLQYGNGQLRINCIDMSYITANSDITGQCYYELDWRQVMKQFNQQKVPLTQVELHKVQFHQQKHKVQFHQQKYNSK